MTNRGFPPIVNFVLDVTQDECTLGVGEVLLPERDHIKDLAYEVEISRFVTGGRLCLNSISTDDSDRMTAIVLVRIIQRTM